jgi:hypothetical protein
VQIDCTGVAEVCIVKAITMKVYCKTCNLPLTNEVKLYTGTSFGEADKQNFIQEGFYTISDGAFFTGSEDRVIINIADLTNATNHTNRSRLNGCCGLDGGDGPNKLCANGHEVATEYSDCWMPHAILFDKEKTFLK